MALSPLNQRRWRNFKANRRAYWALWIFLVLYGLSLFAELIANDRPLLVSYRGALHTPFMTFYPETAFGGDFATEAAYRDAEVQCLIRTGGLEVCLDAPAATMAELEEKGSIGGAEVAEGFIIWPLIPYSYRTVNDLGTAAPSAPDAGEPRTDLVAVRRRGAGTDLAPNA